MAPVNEVPGAVFCRFGQTSSPPSLLLPGGICATTRLRLHEGQPEGTWRQRTNYFDLLGADLPEHLRELLAPPVEMLDGRVVVEGFIGRGECIYTYHPDRRGQTWRLYRPGSVVFDPAALQTLLGAPLTNDHPPADEGYAVTSATWQKYAQGVALDPGRAYPEYGLVAGRYVLSGADILAAWRAGKKYLSTGEYCLEVDTPGAEVDGQPYDSMLVAHSYNHTSLVDFPQAGPLAQFRSNQLPYNVRTHTDPGDPMETVVIVVGGIEFTVPKNEAEAWRARLNNLLAQVPEATQTRLDELTRTNSQLQAKSDELTLQVTELRTHSGGGNGGAAGASEEQIQQRVNAASQARATALTKAWPLLANNVTATDGKLTLTRTTKNDAGQDVTTVVELNTLDEAGLYREAILTRRPNSKLDGKDKGYLEARLDMLLEHNAASDRAASELDRASSTARTNSRGDDSAAQEKLKAAQNKRSAHFERRTTSA